MGFQTSEIVAESIAAEGDETDITVWGCRGGMEALALAKFVLETNGPAILKDKAHPFKFLFEQIGFVGGEGGFVFVVIWTDQPFLKNKPPSLRQGYGLHDVSIVPRSRGNRLNAVSLQTIQLKIRLIR